MKQYPSCGQTKDLERFAPRRERPGRFHSWYRDCDRKKRRKQRDPDVERAHWARRRVRIYGLTLGQLDDPLVAQVYTCAICAEPVDGSAHIDHDHPIGRVRGILCTTGNVGIGSLGDSIPILERAFAYLRRGAEEQ
jgi:hypothetical protein